MSHEATDNERKEMVSRMSSAQEALSGISSYVEDENNPVYARDMMAVKLFSDLIKDWKTARGSQMYDDACAKMEQAKPARKEVHQMRPRGGSIMPATCTATIWKAADYPTKDGRVFRGVNFKEWRQAALNAVRNHYGSKKGAFNVIIDSDETGKHGWSKSRMIFVYMEGNMIYAIPTDILCPECGASVKMYRERKTGNSRIRRAEECTKCNWRHETQ